MPKLLPLFPLQMVAFPSEKLKLHIFEPRYIHLIRECEQKGITFGIPPYIEEVIRPIGTEFKLDKVYRRYTDGRLDIAVVGIGLFRMQHFHPRLENRLYAGAEVEPVEYDLDADPTKRLLLLNLLEDLFSLMGIHFPPQFDRERFTTFDIGHMVGLSLLEEYHLLCISEESSRQEYLLAHLNKMLPVVRQLETMRRRVQQNGHFQNITPPEI